MRSGSERVKCHLFISMTVYLLSYSRFQSYSGGNDSRNYERSRHDSGRDHGRRHGEHGDRHGGDRHDSYHHRDGDR